MSVVPNNLVAYGSADMPEADSAAVGGAVDFTINVAFNDITPSGFVDWVSSSASDTATKAQIAGRDASGVIQTPAAITLNGQTPVTGSQTFERLLYGIITGAVAGSFPLANPGGTAAVGDVACFAHTATVSAHTARAGSANTAGTTPPLFFLQTGDGASVSSGMIIRTTGGTGPNQIRQIVATAGYGTDVVAINRDWTTLWRVARHRPLRRAQRHQHRQPAPADFELRPDRLRRVLDPARPRQRAVAGQPALGRRAEQRRRAGCLDAPHLAGRHHRLQGQRRSAHPRHHDLTA
ncbi:MAG: hypothetical protein IVW56_09660 [Candidatus Binataceae bacterium]|nr:hypothetical protein [Candidatus Binataceae bacterium]